MTGAETSDKPRVSTARAGDLERLLPLIESYQRFYRVEEIERGRNRGFFGRLIAPSQYGALLGAWDKRRAIGYACVHWGLDSVQAREIATLHDLWVEPDRRCEGVGRALIEAAADLAHARGATSLIWETAPDNYDAQRLYDQIGARPSTWVHYELPL